LRGLLASRLEISSSSRQPETGLLAQFATRLRNRFESASVRSVSSGESIPHAAVRNVAPKTVSPSNAESHIQGTMADIDHAQAPASSDAVRVRSADAPTSRPFKCCNLLRANASRSSIWTRLEPATATLIPTWPNGAFKANASAMKTSKSTALIHTGVRVSPSA
jgi:hypothetical protein